MTKYETTSETARRWGVSKQRVHQLLEQGRVKGARKHKTAALSSGFYWEIPVGAANPAAEKPGPRPKKTARPPAMSS